MKPPRKAKKVKSGRQAKALPAPTACELRVKRKGWTEADIAVRLSQARVLRTFRRDYRERGLPMAKQLLRNVRVEMQRSIRDCASLDSIALEQGFQPMFFENFTVFDSDPAMVALHVRSWMKFHEQRAGKKPEAKAFRAKDPELATAKLALHEFREDLRDGYPFEDALERNSGTIADMASIRSVAFFAELGRMIGEYKRRPEKYRNRSLSGWIQRGWITLCLWECEADGREAYQRISDAARLLGYIVPTENSFRNAWRNVRNRNMREAVKQSRTRPKISQIAKAD